MAVYANAPIGGMWGRHKQSTAIVLPRQFKFFNFKYTFHLIYYLSIGLPPSKLFTYRLWKPHHMILNATPLILILQYMKVFQVSMINGSNEIEALKNKYKLFQIGLKCNKRQPQATVCRRSINVIKIILD